MIKQKHLKYETVFQVQVMNQPLVSTRNSISWLSRSYIDNVVSLSSSLLPLIYVCYVLAEAHPRRYKCGLSAPCPPKHLAFRLVSGAANVIGPKICLEDKMWDSVFTSSSLFMCVFVSLCSFVFCFVFSHFVHFFPLCYDNQASKSVWELNASIVLVFVSLISVDSSVAVLYFLLFFKCNAVCISV